MRPALFLVALLLACSVAAQPLTVGTMPPNPFSAGFVTQSGAETIINLSDLATAAGTVNRAAVMWSKPCSAAFKIVFFNSPLFNVTSLSVIDSRGPFNAVAGRNDIVLEPPVTLPQNAAMGVVRLQPFDTCGAPLFQPERLKGFKLVTNKDMSAGGPVGTSANYASGIVPGFIAYNGDPLLVRVLPAAGAVQGVGAFFRTLLQLYNPDNLVVPASISGKLVFHRAGQSASDSDPSLPFTLAPGQTLSYPDIVATMGASGLGSLDVLANGGLSPVVTARVFSDAGASGTSGFTEEGLEPLEALQAIYKTTGVLPVPADLTNFRMNIGIRTLQNGATLAVVSYGPDGTPLGLRGNLVYAPNYFEQVSVTQLLGGVPVAAGGTLQFAVNAGAAFVYGTVTDNRTSDSSMRMAVLH